MCSAEIKIGSIESDHIDPTFMIALIRVSADCADALKNLLRQAEAGERVG